MKYEIIVKREKIAIFLSYLISFIYKLIVQMQMQ